MRKPLTLILCAALCGCMPTKQAAPDQVRDAPAERIFAIAEQKAPTGTITVVRDVGFIGGGCFLGLMVDGKIAAHLDPAERVVLQLSEGRHVLTATLVQGRGLCGALQSEKSNTARRRSTEVVVVAGQAQNYRMYTAAEGSPIVEPAF